MEDKKLKCYGVYIARKAGTLDYLYKAARYYDDGSFDVIKTCKSLKKARKAIHKEIANTEYFLLENISYIEKM